MASTFDVGIIGTGFAGITAALEIQRAGLDSFVMFERAEDVGGVWRDTVYPGCACDVPAPLYSIARRPNPNWSSNFAGQREILSYLRTIATRDGLLEHIRFGTEIVSAQFSSATGQWRLTDTAGRTFTVRVLLLALGPHSRPYIPRLEGQEAFAGTTFHSSHWDPAINLTGRNVAVLGTGASAVQIIPKIAPTVKQLTVFQRSAPWVLPRGERKLSATERWLYRTCPRAQAAVREAIYWAMELIGFTVIGPPIFSRALAAVARLHLARGVRNPATRLALRPGYRIGCARILLSDDYYPSFNRSNVRLVTQPVSRVLPNGLITADGQFVSADHIVFATGYTVADPDGLLRLTGLDGRTLTEEWTSKGAEAYLGTTVSGYPNLAMLLGPNSGLSHSSAIHVIESQMKYVMQYMAAIRGLPLGCFLDVQPSEQARYNAELQSRLANMVWNSGCSSWYLNRHGKNTVTFPGLTWTFRRRLKTFDDRAYTVGLANQSDKQ
jgi:cation diffusion facilitator CzcD-associated flavoprotein CzcO